MEKKFFKALSYIKKKDPQIYNENVKFFTKDESGGSQDQNKSKKKKKETPLNLRAYERKLIVERGGELSDEGMLSLFILFGIVNSKSESRISVI